MISSAMDIMVTRKRLRLHKLWFGLCYWVYAVRSMLLGLFCFGLYLFGAYVCFWLISARSREKIQNSQFYTSLNHISGSNSKKLQKNPHLKEFLDFFAAFIHIQPTTYFIISFLLQSAIYLHHILDFFHEIICIHPKSAPMIIYYPQRSRHAFKLFTTIPETSLIPSTSTQTPQTELTCAH